MMVVMVFLLVTMKFVMVTLLSMLMRLLSSLFTAITIVVPAITLVALRFPTSASFPINLTIFLFAISASDWLLLRLLCVPLLLRLTLFLFRLL